MASIQQTQRARFRFTKGARGPELVIALPDGVDSAALPGLGKSLAQALSIVALQGAEALIARADAVAAAAVAIAAPPAELIDERIAQRRGMQRIVEQTEWYSAEQIRELLHKRVAPTVDWKRRGKIFGIHIGEREFFPAWQFGEDLRPLPVVAQVLKALGPIADPWKMAAWFHFPNPWLARRTAKGGKVTSRSPKDCLDQGAQLLEAARQRQRSYVA